MTQGASPWAQLSGQVLLGSAEFIRQTRERLGEKDVMQEIPREQRHVGRPPLTELFPPRTVLSKSERDRLTLLAHVSHGYTLKEIARVLELHYTTVSKIINHDKN